MRVLIDRNIERNAITHRSVEKPRRIRWGEDDITVHVLEREAFPPRRDEVFRNEQLPFLASVAELARAGHMRLFISHEVRMEGLRQRDPGPGYVGLDLLEGVPIETVRSPVDRTIVICGAGRSVGVAEAEQMEFFRSIRDSRFLAIRKMIGDAHIDDAFHLWTGEAARLDVFLTMDRKFLNVMAHQGHRLGSPVRVWSPKALCAAFGEGPTDIDTLAAKYHPFR